MEFAFGTSPVSGSVGELVYNGTFAGGGTIGQTGSPEPLRSRSGEVRP